MDVGADMAVHAPVQRDEQWLRYARIARWLSWTSLLWMTAEGGIGIAAGIAAHSIALVGWALSSAVEGLASAIVIWRFSGSRTHSETSERRGQQLVAVSFFLLAPYVAVESIRDLLSRNDVHPNALGIGLLASSAVLMPLLGIAKRRLGTRLHSGATAGEGNQNLLCAYLAVAVLAGLVSQRLFGWWWVDPVAGLAVAAVAVKEGRDTWRGEDCCAPVLASSVGASGCEDESGDCC